LAAESAEGYGVNPVGKPPRGSFVFYRAEGPIDGVEKIGGMSGYVSAMVIRS